MPRPLLLHLAREQNPEQAFEFDFSPQNYRVRWGTVERRARFPWTEDLQEDLADLEALAADSEVQAGLGQTLRRFLEKSGWWDANVAALEACRLHGGRTDLLVRSKAAELYALPWELVQLDDGTPLGAIPELLVRYEWPKDGASTRSRPVPQQTAGRTIFAWSGAGGRVPEQQHADLLRQALSRAPSALEQRLIEVPDVRRATLKAALESARIAGEHIAVLHLLCHGTAVGKPGHRHFALAWADKDEARGPVDGPELVRILEPYKELVASVVLCACQGGGRGEVDGRVGSIAQELHRAGIPGVVASRLPLSVAGSVVLTRTLYPALLEDSASLEEGVLSARVALRQDPELPEVGGGLDWTSLQLLVHSGDARDHRPYALEPWCPATPLDGRHRAFLVGRGPTPRLLLPPERWRAEAAGTELGRLSARLSAAVARPGPGRLQALLGGPGVGKTSLVLAGIAPALQEGEELPWRLLLAEPHHSRDARGPCAQWTHQLDGLERVGRADEGEAEAFSGLVERLREASGPTLLLLDQAEELLTHATPEIARRTLSQLWTLALHDELEVVVLIVCRSESWQDLVGLGLADTEQTPAFERHTALPLARFELASWTRADLASVVELNARLAGLEVPSTLVEAVLDDLTDVASPLPLLTWTLVQLWKRRSATRVLDLELYHRIGGSSGALASRLDELVLHEAAAQTPARSHLTGEAHRQESPRAAAARTLFLALGSGRSSATRPHVVVLSELTDPSSRAALDPEALRDLVDELLGAGVLVSRPGPTGQAGRAVALGHPALLDSWPRLEAWRLEDQHATALVADVEHAADSWQRNKRPEADLARGGSLAMYRLILEEHRPRLSGVARDYIDESSAAARRRRNRQRTFQIASAVFLLSIAVAAVGSALVLRELRDEAVEAHGLARDASLVAATEALGTRDPTQGLQLLKEVANPEEHPRWAALATRLLVHPFSSAVLGPLDGGVLELEVASGVDWFLAGDEAGTTWVLPLDGRAASIPLRHHTEGESFDPVMDLAISPNRRQLAVILDSGMACVATVPLRAEQASELTQCVLHEPAPHEEGELHIAFSSDGSMVVTAGRGRLRQWSHNNQELAPEGELAIPPDLELVELYDETEGLWWSAGRAWVGPMDSPQGSTVFDVPAHADDLPLFALSEDRLHLAILRPGEGVTRLDPGSVGEPAPSSSLSLGSSLALDRDSWTALAGSEGTSLELVHLDGEAPSIPLSGHQSSVTVVAFQPGGGHLISGSLDRHVRVWPRPRKVGDRALDLPNPDDKPWAIASYDRGFVTPNVAEDASILMWWQATEGGLWSPKPAPLEPAPAPFDSVAGDVQALAVVPDFRGRPLAIVGTSKAELVAQLEPERAPTSHQELQGPLDTDEARDTAEPGPAPLPESFGSIWGVDACTRADGEVLIAAVSGQTGWGKLALLHLRESGWELVGTREHDAALWATTFVDDQCREVLAVDDVGQLISWTDQAEAAQSRVRVLYTHPAHMPAFAVDAGSGCVVQGFVDGSLSAHPLPGTEATGRCDTALEGHGGAVWNVSLDDDHTQVLAASLDGILSVQGLHSSEGLGMMSLDAEGGLYDGAFVRQGQLAIAVGDLSHIRVWDLVARHGTAKTTEARVHKAVSACLPARQRVALLRERPAKAARRFTECEAERMRLPEAPQ